MNNRNVLIVVVIILVIACAASIFLNHNTQKETHIEIISNSTLHEKDNVTVKLTDNKGNGIAGETVKATFANSKGWTKTFELKTDSEGIATFEITDTEPGNYTIKCSYLGNDNYKNSNATKSVTLVENATQTTSTDSTV